MCYQHHTITIANFKAAFKTKELSHKDVLSNQLLKYKLSEKTFVLYFCTGDKIF